MRFGFALLLLLPFVSAWVKQMENDGMFEGDMLLTPDQQMAVQNGFTSIKKNFWPRTIYYDWEPTLANERSILDAIADYEKYTCFKFVKRTNEKDYIHFFKGSGCFSGVGYFPGSGKHSVSIGPGCSSKGVVIHEIGHRIGIYHEQGRVDRDKYINIHYENIVEKYKYAFRKFSSSQVTSHGTIYDFRSVMHYGSKAFSKNGKQTITTKDPKYQHQIGNRQGFSELDKIQINRMYKCSEAPPTNTPKPATVPTQAPSGPKVVLKHGHWRCLSLNNAGELIFTTRCKHAFEKIDGGYFRVHGTWRCIEPGRNDVLMAGNKCVSNYERTDIQPDGSFSILHKPSGKCIHPKGGSSYPRDGTVALIYRGCSGKRLKFKQEEI
ncbi:astacin-like metalloprotease toxin 1 [Clytia hemisphaerica]|uniref:Metalloendopeptidase n=1 Tax=Clytia hemisphaerica TaxID=252671 RepID=A0A7M5VB40_9CNID